MKTLVVLGEPPLPEGGALAKVGLGLLRGLAHHDVEVTAVAARPPWAHPGTTPPGVAVEEVEVAPDAPWRGRLSAIVRPNDLLGRGAFEARVRELGAGCDIIHLESVETAWSARRISGPTLLHLYYRQRLDRDLGRPWSRRFRHDLGFVRAERAALRRHRWVLATSPAVAATVRAAAPRAEVVEVRMALDPTAYLPAALDGPPVAGLIGTGGWGPTADATRRLLGRVWPAVHRRAPDARLRLAGRGIRDLVGPNVPGVEVVGEVPSAAAFLAGLSVLLYPLERGSGVKLKVLEALAAGLPVVTTTPGAEGVDGGDGIVVADADAALVEAALAILGDGGERAQRGRAARERFDRSHAPGVATAPLVDLYRRML